LHRSGWKTVPCSRSRGKDVYYLPGGKRGPGESDIDTLVREIHEGLSVAIVPDTTRSSSTIYMRRRACIEASVNAHTQVLTIPPPPTATTGRVTQSLNRL
jgi:hypothetical protein